MKQKENKMRQEKKNKQKTKTNKFKKKTQQQPHPLPKTLRNIENTLNGSEIYTNETDETEFDTEKP